jgi:uncharacterized membrane protein
MSRNSDLWNKERIETVLGNVLRAGVILAFAVVLAGGIVYLIRHGQEKPQDHAFLGEPSDLRSVAGVIGGALSGHGRGVIQLGILLLIATPVTRVALSVYAFAQQGDHTYVIVTMVVLSVLLYSLFGG